MQRLSFLLVVTTGIFFGTTLLSPNPVYACSCAVEAGVTKQERVEEAFSQAGAVFAGRVSNIEDPPSPMSSSMAPVTVTFDVSKVWKGSGAQIQEITTPFSGASCGYEFRAGEEYLVYASEDMKVLLCGETKPLSNAKVDLETLGASGVLPDTSGAVGSPYEIPHIAAGVAILLAASSTLAALTFLKKPSRRL